MNRVSGTWRLYLRDLGEVDESLKWGCRGVDIAPTSSAMLHNVALLEQRTRNKSGAVALWRAGSRFEVRRLPARRFISS